MPRTPITAQQLSRLTATTPTNNAVDAANGNSIDNSGQDLILIVTNGSGGDLTVTFVVPGTFEDQNRPDVAFVIPTGGVRAFGGWTSAYDNNDTDNDISNALYVNWSTGSSVTCQVLKL